MDVQGSELEVLRGGTVKLSQAVVVQTEISFVPLYKEQPVFGDIDLELRSQGFIPHCFAAVKYWPIAPGVIDNDPRKPLNADYSPAHALRRASAARVVGGEPAPPLTSASLVNNPG